jgi:hypothetical protein
MIGIAPSVDTTGTIAEDLTGAETAFLIDVGLHCPVGGPP